MLHVIKLKVKKTYNIYILKSLLLLILLLKSSLLLVENLLLLLLIFLILKLIGKALVSIFYFFNN